MKIWRQGLVFSLLMFFSSFLSFFLCLLGGGVGGRVLERILERKIDGLGGKNLTTSFAIKRDQNQGDG